MEKLGCNKVEKQTFLMRAGSYDHIFQFLLHMLVLTGNVSCWTEFFLSALLCSWLFIHELWTGVDRKCQRYLRMISNTYSFVIFYRDVCCFMLFKTDRICLFIPVVGQKIFWEYLFNSCQYITTYSTIWYFIQTHFFELGRFSFMQFF